MALGRLWRTIRYITGEQWVYRFVCRSRRIAMGCFPDVSQRWTARAAHKLPLPEITNPESVSIGEIILILQRAVHGETYQSARHGKFRLLNRDYDFGSIENIQWRGDFDEGNNPLRRMNLAYMGYVVPLLANGKPEDLRIVGRLLASFVSKNSWSEPGVFSDVWNTYTVSHRLINLLSGLALYRRAGGAPDNATERKILEHTRFCAAFICANLERDLQFNHLMKNFVALTVYSAMCEAKPLAFSVLRTAVPRSICQNILADGGHAERSPMYHILSLLDMRVFAASRLHSDVWKLLLDKTICRMTAALSAMTLADGEIALMNDSWVGEAPTPSDLIANTALKAGRLPLTGYESLRGGGDSVVFDCGPCGPDKNPGHAHADFLSIEATVAGKRFLVDTGVPTYTAGDLRDAARSAAAHNGPRLIGEEPLEFWKSFRVGRRGYAGLLDTSRLADLAPLQTAGWQSGYAYLKTDVRRFIGLWPGRALLLADLWLGSAENASVRFLISGHWDFTDKGVYEFDETHISVRALLGSIYDPKVASHWTRFDVKETAHKIDVLPVATVQGARSAVLFTWDKEFQEPDHTQIKTLFDRLGEAIPHESKLGYN